MNEAELTFSHILNYGRTQLYQNRGSLLEKSQAVKVASVLRRRIQGEPLAYILGKTEFMGLEFKVKAGVLIPRPETEILVETVVRLVQSSKSRVQRVLDLGTGSGCIAVSLAKFLPDVDITAADISEAALKIAKQNAASHDVKIKFLCSDLFPSDKLVTTSYDLIVSNPPYVRAQDLDSLQPEIKHEPRIALAGGQDGMDFFRRIITDAPRHLKKDGFLVLEIGYAQSGPIRKLFKKSGYLEILEVIKDYRQIDRVIVARSNRQAVKNG